VTLLSPVEDYNSSQSSVTIKWEANDLYWNYTACWVYVDSNSTAKFFNSSVPVPTIQLETILKGLSEGSHLINISTLDSNANYNKFLFSLFVDLTNPTMNIITPVANSTVNNQFSLAWSASDGESGYHYAEIYVDGNYLKRVDGSLKTTSISGLSAGQHTINVTVYDYSGRSSSQIIQISVLGPKPGIPGFNIAILTMSFAATAILLIYFKKNKI
jgi:hypothetical protein